MAPPIRGPVMPENNTKGDSLPLLLDRPGDIRVLRRALDEAGFTHGGVLEALGQNVVSLRSGKDLPLLMRLTREETPRNALVRLFLMDVPVPEETASRLLSPGVLGLLTDAGLARADGGSVVPRLKVLPYEGYLFAFDSPGRLREGDSGDYVMGIGKSTISLSNLTVRRRSRATLDLGTGCGFQAVMAARHSDRVVGSDVNPRAVRLATFNAALNDLPQVECVLGDLFEPVAERRFDLIVSNPPFVISPESRYAYRDSGMEGDAICRKIVREAPRHLAEGGFCQIMGNWAVRSGEDWKEAVGRWFADTGCDAWVLCSDRSEAGAYAWKWIDHTEMGETGRRASQYEEWLACYERQGIESVCLGYILMRKRSGGANWTVVEEEPDGMVGPCGDDVLRGFALRDFLRQAKDDGEILRHAYRPSPHLSITSSRGPAAGGWEDRFLHVALEKGFAYKGNIDRISEALITRCDGERPLRHVLQEIASLFGADVWSLGSPACAIVRGLVEKGFLWPPTIGPDGIPLRENAEAG